MSNLKINDYIMINNKDIGKIIKLLWNDSYIIKLENNDIYIDHIIKQYKLLDEISNINGYMYINPNDTEIQVLASEPITIISDPDNDLNLINIYIKNLLKNLFIGENKIVYCEDMTNDIDKENIKNNLYVDDNNVKDIILERLNKYQDINMHQYYNYKNTAAYRHLLIDNDIDILSYGQMFISKIKFFLNKIQLKFLIEGTNNSIRTVTNLFKFLTFHILSNGYIEIINDENLNKKYRLIDESILKLNYLKSQHMHPINYELLSNIILQNNNSSLLELNKEIVIEALQILSQEYLICFQPKVELTLWFTIRIILCWYSDPLLFEHIQKVKILINLFRARPDKEINQNLGLLPIIIIYPKYGKESTVLVLSRLSFLFFPYKKLGLEFSNPVYFNKIDNLMYYTNGSIDLKQYINYIMGSDNNVINPLSEDFTRIDMFDETKIEFDMPEVDI